MTDRSERMAACAQAGASIFEVWSDEARTDVREGIVATGLRYAPVPVYWCSVVTNRS